MFFTLFEKSSTAAWKYLLKHFLERSIQVHILGTFPRSISFKGLQTHYEYLHYNRRQANVILYRHLPVILDEL